MLLAAHTGAAEQGDFGVFDEAVGDGGGEVAEWDVRTGDMKRRWLPAEPVFSAALAPDGFTLAIGCAGKIGIWNVNTAHLVRTLQETPSRWSPGVLSFTPDGRMIAGGHGNELIRVPGNPAGWPEYFEAIRNVHIWNADGAYLMRLKATQPGEVTAVAFFPDGRRIAVGSTTGVLRVYELR